MSIIIKFELVSLKEMMCIVHLWKCCVLFHQTPIINVMNFRAHWMHLIKELTLSNRTTQYTQCALSIVDELTIFFFFVPQLKRNLALLSINYTMISFFLFLVYVKIRFFSLFWFFLWLVRSWNENYLTLLTNAPKRMFDSIAMNCC